EAFAPLGVYGQSKAAGDIAVANCPRHYILRSSWVIGEGRNFVKTMMGLSDRVAKGELPEVTVVDDQYGRLTFTKDMADAIFHLLDGGAAYGTYNLTGSGAVKSWADIARTVFDLTNGNGPGRAGLGGVSEGIHHQGTQEVTDLSRAVSSAKPPETCVIRFL
ncbi:SDR family oxidoreductase, partial [Bifidobacterium pseudocatenulatum]|uniref:SDR family oxidoreductase n=1 Tax=Bifidobacterium pseudocatenulatum TaxID=28026 RepID=UPI003A4E348F